MAEIDTRPLESVREAVTLFEPRSDPLNRFNPDRNVGNTQEEEIIALTKELATCKLQLEARENEAKQAILKLEALQKATQELSDKYDRACLDSHGRIAQLEVENSTIRSRQSEMAHECKALRDELAVVKGELDAAKASVAIVLKEVEMVEAREIMERESTKEALTRILQLNETVLSSAVAAVRAEEERSVFFQEVTLEFFNSNKNLEVIRRQNEMMESMERELLAKTVEIEYLRSELNQAREKYVSSQEVCDATADTGGCRNLEDRQVQVRETADTGGCKNREDRPVQVCETGVIDQEPEAEFTFQHAPEECFVPEIFSKDCQVVPSDGVHKTSDEDHRAIQQDDKSTDAENDQQPPESDGVPPNSNACEANLLHDHEEPKVDASFILESSRDDFQSVHSDGKDISISMPEHVAGYQEAGAEAELVATCEADAVKDKLLEAARAEISDLRFSLEEAVRRAELAEEAKAALERELREEIRNKHPSRRRAASDSEDTRRPAREGPLPKPALPRQMPPRGPRSARPGGEDMPTPRCVTLGKVLNMKYK